MTDEQLKEIPEIKAALDEGFTLAQVKGHPKFTVTLAADGARLIDGAESQFGRGTPEWHQAIDEANRRSVTLTSAAAAYERTIREG